MPMTKPESIAEILLVFANDCGLESVPELLSRLELDRESLSEVAAEYASVGLRDLAALVRRAARKARPKSIEEMSFDERKARGLPLSLAGLHYERQRRQRQGRD
jgi:hypothetical protein